jgi:hypothetical protein
MKIEDLLRILNQHHIPYRILSQTPTWELELDTHHRQLVGTYLVHLAQASQWPIILAPKIPAFLKAHMRSWTYRLIHPHPQEGIKITLTIIPKTGIADLIYSVYTMIVPTGIWKVMGLDSFNENETALLGWLKTCTSQGWFSRVKILYPYSSILDWISCRWVYATGGLVLQIKLSAPKIKLKQAIIRALQEKDLRIRCRIHNGLKKRG